MSFVYEAWLSYYFHVLCQSSFAINPMCFANSFVVVIIRICYISAENRDNIEVMGFGNRFSVHGRYSIYMADIAHIGSAFMADKRIYSQKS